MKAQLKFNACPGNLKDYKTKCIVNCIRKKTSVITTTSCKNIEDIFFLILNSPTNNQANIDDCVSKDEHDERYVILGVRTK